VGSEKFNLSRSISGPLSVRSVQLSMLVTLYGGVCSWPMSSSMIFYCALSLHLRAQALCRPQCQSS